MNNRRCYLLYYYVPVILAKNYHNFHNLLLEDDRQNQISFRIYLIVNLKDWLYMSYKLVLRGLIYELVLSIRFLGPILIGDVGHVGNKLYDQLKIWGQKYIRF